MNEELVMWFLVGALAFLGTSLFIACFIWIELWRRKNL